MRPFLLIKVAVILAAVGCSDGADGTGSTNSGSGGSASTVVGTGGNTSTSSVGGNGGALSSGGSGGNVGPGGSGGSGGVPWTGVPTDRPLRIAFIGNSFTHQGPIPHLVRDLAASAGWPTPDVDYNAPGGTTLAQHQTFAASVDLVDAGGWDFVVLQEFSTRPTDNAGNPAAFKDSATWFYDRAKLGSPDAQVILYETWARHPDHFVYPNTFANPAEMQAQLRFHYSDAANNFIPNNSTALITGDLGVAPVGDAWEYHLASANALRLHGGDDYHAGENGQYLNAAVLYSTIYGVVANGISSLGISLNDASQLQLAADAITGNTLDPPFEKPTLALGRTVRVDFGSDPTAAAGWNTLTDCVNGTSVALSDDQNAPSGIDVGIGDAFAGANAAGLAGNTLGYPGDVSSDLCWMGSFDGHAQALLQSASVTLNNVAPGSYELTLFASRSGNDGGSGRLTRYTAQGQSLDLECSDNTSDAAFFAGVSPDPQGRIVIDVAVSPAGTSRFGYLGALTLKKTAN